MFAWILRYYYYYPLIFIYSFIVSFLLSFQNQVSAAAAVTKPSSRTASTSSVEGAYLIADHIERFKQDCIEVLSTLEGHCVPLFQFPEFFMKVKKEQFLLVNYKAKKMMHLLEAIPEAVEVQNLYIDRL